MDRTNQQYRLGNIVSNPIILMKLALLFSQMLIKLKNIRYIMYEIQRLS